jgi:hypothetical protein
MRRQHRVQSYRARISAVPGMRRHALLDFPRVAAVRFPRVRFGPSIRTNQSRVSRDHLDEMKTTGTATLPRPTLWPRRQPVPWHQSSQPAAASSWSSRACPSRDTSLGPCRFVLVALKRIAGATMSG